MSLNFRVKLTAWANTNTLGLRWVAMASSAYENIRGALSGENGSDARVEVNQRALIDKILARYASNGAVYRELLQNSNDAEATTAEIIITTSPSSNGDSSGVNSNNNQLVTQVIYRNNGLPFRPQDWARLRKIAEGNPDESKVGAFGVGACKFTPNNKVD